MKNNIWVSDKKNIPKKSKDIECVKKSISPEMIYSDKRNFHRITGSNHINTTGEQPLILYKKKESRISHSFEYKMTKKNNDNNIFITDGGLKLKNKKYKTKYNIVSIKKDNIPFNYEINKILTNYAILYDKSTKNKNFTINMKGENQDNENVYYRTVRGLSNRPTFKKKKLFKSDELRKDKIKFRKRLQKYEESKKNEENKSDLKKNLIKGGTKNINLLIKLIKNQKKLKNKNVEKKKEFLQKNGIGVSDINIDLDNFEEEKKQSEKEDTKKMYKTHNNFHKKNNNYIKNYNNINSSEKMNICITLDNDDYKEKNNRNKISFKPKVDQLEFIKKINEEQKIIHTQENTSIKNTKKNKIKNNMFLSYKIKTNNELNDSFRHNNKISHNKMTQKKSKSKSKEKEYLSKKMKELPSSLIDVINDEWPYSHKKSYRSPKELIKFKKEKKILKREKANIQELEKNTKLFNKFKNLANLNYKGKNNISHYTKDTTKDKDKLITKISAIKSIDINKSARSAKVRKPRLPFKKGKEINECYKGDESKVNNNSTLIELNKYYLNILESQQLLVNAGFSRKNYYDGNNDSGDNYINYNEETLNSSKERIHNIIKKKNVNKNENINIKKNYNKNIKINNYINYKDHVNNKKIKSNKKIINPKDILKLIEIIKFIIQRKTYVILYKYYIDLAIYQHYSIAFSYFIAICKNYPFRKIIAFCGYKSYDILIKKLFLPFIRKNFRDFVGQLYFKKKLKYFIFRLNKFFKFKALEKIFIASQLDNSEERYFQIVIFKIMKTLFKPHLQEVFDKLNNYSKNKSKAKEDKKMVKVDTNKINKNNKINELIESSEKSDKYQKIAKKYLEYSPTYKKAKSYLYETFNDDSSFSVRPNSLDNHQWAKIQAKLNLARFKIMNNDSESEGFEEDSYEIKKNNKNNNDLNKENKNKIEEKEKKQNFNLKDDKEINNKNINKKEKQKKDDIKEKKIIEKHEEKKEDINNIVKKHLNDIDDNYDNENQKKLEKTKTISDIDISADRDEGNNIEWEYDLDKAKSAEKNDKKINNINENENSIKNPEQIKTSEKNEKKLQLIDSDEEEEEEQKNYKKIKIEEDKISEIVKNDNSNNKKNKENDKKLINNDEEEEDYLGEFDDLKIESDTESDKRKKQKKEEKEKEKEKNDIIKPKEEKILTNEKENAKEKTKEEKKDINMDDTNIKIIKKDSDKLKDLSKIKNINEFTNNLTEEIIKKILSTEITSEEVKLIPHKSFKFDIFSNLNGSQSNLSATGSGSANNNINKELNLLGLNQLSLNDDLLNDSIMSSYSAFSVFNKTIKDKKKEHSLNLYFKKISPKLIQLIKEEIILKYPRIYANISTPLKNKSVGLMMSLCLQDADMLKDNYKCNEIKESIRNIIDKEGILKKFEPINKQIRSKDKVTSDNFYDNMLNDCLIDTTIELINKERFYGENGDPLEWSSRIHELAFKFKKNDAKIFAKYICKNLIKTMLTRVGLITENYDYMNAEQINEKRDKKLIDNIKNELDEDEYQWRNLEMEETQLKVEIAEMIMEQLYNENIEILEHIQYSRNRPDLYLNKSIYACEEIPKLSFQQTTTENATKEKEENDEVNMK